MERECDGVRRDYDDLDHISLDGAASSGRNVSAVHDVVACGKRVVLLIYNLWCKGNTSRYNAFPARKYIPW